MSNKVRSTMLKTILFTFTTTIAIVTLFATLFLNTILGAFGLAATSIETLQNLKTSQQIVERMKTRQAQKKLKFTKRFAKRIASAAVAAATVGTIGVAVAVTALEANDYCEEKSELQEDADILNGTKTEFDYRACYEDGKKDLSAVLTQVKDSTVEAASDAWKSTAHYSAEKWTSIKESCSDALESAGGASSRLWDAAVAWVTD